MPVSIPYAGELTHRIELIKRVDKPSALNMGAMQEDSVIWKGWAKKEPTGAAYWLGSQTEDRITHRFWVRNIPGVTDVYSLNHGILIREGKQIFRPKRVTDANDLRKWTLIEAQEVGEDRPEGKQSLLQESINA